MLKQRNVNPPDRVVVNVRQDVGGSSVWWIVVVVLAVGAIALASSGFFNSF